MKRNEYLHELKQVTQLEISIIDLFKKLRIKVNNLLEETYKKKYKQKKRKKP